MAAVNRGGRGRISCTPDLQPRVLWLISRGWTFEQAGSAYGMSANAIGRQATRDPEFRRQLDGALEHRRVTRPVAVHTSSTALSPTPALIHCPAEKTSVVSCNGARSHHLEETG